MEIEARVSELSGWLPSLSFDFCYLLFNFASYWAFRLFEFSNGSWSVFCNFHLFEFSADNVYRLPLLLNFSIESITFLPEYQVCVAQYFCLITFSNYPNFLFILICGLCRVSGGFLKFRLLTNAPGRMLRIPVWFLMYFLSVRIVGCVSFPAACSKFE